MVYWADKRDFPVFFAVKQRYPTHDELLALSTHVEPMLRMIEGGFDPRALIQSLELRCLAKDLTDPLEMWAPIGPLGFAGRVQESRRAVKRLAQRLSKTLKRIARGPDDRVQRRRV